MIEVSVSNFHVKVECNSTLKFSKNADGTDRVWFIELDCLEKVISLLESHAVYLPTSPVSYYDPSMKAPEGPNEAAN